MKGGETLSKHINLLLKKFTECLVPPVASNDNNKSVEVPRDVAVEANPSPSAGSSDGKKNETETECCTICTEYRYVDKMFSITSCGHSYCFWCMSKHVEFKLHQGMLPTCPHDKCTTKLILESCKEFLTRELLVLMIKRLKEARSDGKKNENETECCTICTEYRYVDKMFSITSCGHSYCFWCMSKHVEFKLHQGMLPTCPHDKCTAKLILERCKEFLTRELLVLMIKRLKEARIPAAERIYCPNPGCSVLFSRTELQGCLCIGNDDGDEYKRFKSRKCCPKCKGFFCMDCRVPWHQDMLCSEYKRRDHPETRNEDKIFKSLASKNLWRQCPKCNHMVSLDSGCYHIYCRCGHEFCFTCGAPWINKKATCNCPAWDERNIRIERNIQRGR